MAAKNQEPRPSNGRNKRAGIRASGVVPAPAATQADLSSSCHEQTFGTFSLGKKFQKATAECFRKAASLNLRNR